MANAKEARKGREGSRWINERPSGEEVADWFSHSVPLHEGMEHANYVSGITLIQQTEKAKEVVGWRENQTPIIEERPVIVYTPYPRVDIRIKYFHDLMDQNPEWLGVIEPTAVPPTKGAVLPPGFFAHRVRNDKGEEVAFVCCSMKVTVYERKSVGYRTVTIDKRTGETRQERTGTTIIDSPPATKAVATLGRYGPDPFAMMKAETGAIGRALGMAGMLVVPGAGVATAEDLGEAQDLAANPPAAEAAEGAKLPEPTTEDGKAAPEDDEALRERAKGMIEKLEADFPEIHAEFKAWAKEKKLGTLGETTSPALRGVVKQLEKKLDEAAAAKS